MNDIIRLRAHRTLRKLAHFREPIPADLQRLLIPEGLLKKDEIIIGVYENQIGKIEESIIITDQGFYILLNGWEIIPYKEIDNVEPLMKTEKTSAQELLIHLKSGKEFMLPIKGGDDKFRDVWEVLHFFNHVVQDYADKNLK